MKYTPTPRLLSPIDRLPVRRGGQRALMAVGVLCLALLASLAAIAPALAAPAPKTSIDSQPATPTNQTTATFTFSSSRTPATFTCKLDAGAAAACTSPKTYTGLTQGSHTVTIQATSGGVPNGSPPSATWLVDLTAPTTPGSLAGSAPSPTSVALTWSASTDTGGSGLAGYTVLRDGATLATLGLVTSYTDNTVAAGSTHTYTVRARDAAGNTSALSNAVSVTTPLNPPPDTIIDTRPATPTNLTTATFTFHSTGTPATFTCTLDGVAAACTSSRPAIAA